jgi:hypothetical protein
MNGSDNKIFPDNALTRGELATILSRAFGLTKAQDITRFTDVDADEWYADGISKAVAYGFLNGTSKTQMSPKQNVSRQDVFTILYRALDLQKIEAQVANFKDGDQVSDYAADAINTMVGLNYAKGNLGYLRPLDNMSRAEFATLMARVVNQYIVDEGEYAQSDILMGSVMIKSPNVVLKDVTIYGDLIIAPETNPTLENVSVNGRKVEIENKPEATSDKPEIKP